MFDFSENIWYNHTVITNKGRCDMKPLSKSQQKIFDYLKECAGEGRVPSVREICEETGLSSTSTVHHHLKALEEKGLISREHGVNRCIQINGMEKNTDVPVLGRVAAGYPILAVENIECYVPVPDSLKRGRELFALRVQGESMINAGIFPDDILIVHRTPVAENGEIVVALVGDEATVKRFYKEYYEEQLNDFMEGKSQKGTALDEVNEYVGEFFVPNAEMWYPDGENGPQVLERVMPVLHEWIDSGKQNIAVVTHGGVIRILLCALFGGDFAKRLMFGTSLENCSITQIHFDEKKHGFYLDRFNDFAHLEKYPELMRSTFLAPNGDM